MNVFFNTFADISQIKHPAYTAEESDWKKYRLTYTGGDAFREEYMKQFSTRENAQDFTDRKEMSYVPAFAKAAVIEIKNSIFNRMMDVKRIGGTETYQKVIDGTKPGVDRENGSMNAFMGGDVLPELLAIRKVGIFVDRPSLEGEKTGTKADDVGRIPYLYTYQAEQIRSWKYGEDKQLVNLLLQATVDEVDEETELVVGEVQEYRLFKKVEGGVEVTIYDDKDEVKEATTLYPWTMIPCAIIEVPHSILEDVADYQIAHMNVASSDIAFAWKANFPFYVEQRDPHADNTHLRRVNQVEGDDDDGTAAKARKAADKENRIGVVRGRSYSKGLDAPAFIHPSPDPLKVSMEKQDAMKREIRQLVQLAVTNMDPRRESAESKSMDARGLEAGLSYVAQELERAERVVAEIWAMYEQSEKDAQIKYPEDYSLKTVQDRIKEGKELTELAKSNPSLKYQKEMTKLAAEVTVGNRVSSEILEEIKSEIDSATVVFVDPEALIEDVEAGLATTTTVSEIRGYPKGEAEKAKKEHAERAARIVQAQTAAKDQGPNNAASRGVKDLDPDAEQSPEEEKKLSQSRDVSVDDTKGVRE
jgi:hypothetical protein